MAEGFRRQTASPLYGLGFSPLSSDSHPPMVPHISRLDDSTSPLPHPPAFPESLSTQNSNPAAPHLNAIHSAPDPEATSEPWSQQATIPSNRQAQRESNRTPMQRFQPVRSPAPIGINTTRQDGQPSRRRGNVSATQAQNRQFRIKSRNYLRQSTGQPLPPEAPRESTLRERPRRWQQRLHRRLLDNQNPTSSQKLKPVIVFDSKNKRQPFQAMFCQSISEYSVVHPSALRRIGFRPEDLPGTVSRRLLLPDGIADAKRYAGLVIEYLPYGIEAMPETFWVLDDKVEYREVDVYLGRRFLGPPLHGHLPASVSSTREQNGYHPVHAARDVHGISDNIILSTTRTGGSQMLQMSTSMTSVATQNTPDQSGVVVSLPERWASYPAPGDGGQFSNLGNTSFPPCAGHNPAVAVSNSQPGPSQFDSWNAGMTLTNLEFDFQNAPVVTSDSNTDSVPQVDDDGNFGGIFEWSPQF